MSHQIAAIGVDVGGTATKAGAVTRSGEVRGRIEAPTVATAGTKGVIAAVEELLQREDALGVEVCAVGIGAAGFVHAESGSVTFSPNLVYDDSRLRDALHARVGLPITVENDANAAAWGERAFGSARGSDHVAVVTIGTGVGSGLIVDGRLLRGSSGAGGEFGHTVIDPTGPPCSCGLRGCVEQFASGMGIERMAREAVTRDPDSRILALAGGSPESIEAVHVAQAAEHDETARSVLNTAGRMLGIALSNLVNVFDPELIVLSGSVLGAGEPYLGAARDELYRMTTAQRRRPMRLDVSSLGNDGGIVGAGALALDALAGG